MTLSVTEKADNSLPVYRSTFTTKLVNSSETLLCLVVKVKLTKTSLE